MSLGPTPSKKLGLLRWFGKLPDFDRSLKCFEISGSSMYWPHLENRLFAENAAMRKIINKPSLIAIYYIVLNNWPLDEVSEKLQAYQGRQQVVWATILLNSKIIFQKQSFLLCSASFILLHSLQNSSWFVIIDKCQEDFKKTRVLKIQWPWGSSCTVTL